MKIGILCACSPEFEPYRKALGGDVRTVCGAKVIEGTLCAKEVAVLFAESVRLTPRLAHQRSFAA